MIGLQVIEHPAYIDCSFRCVRDGANTALPAGKIELVEIVGDYSFSIRYPQVLHLQPGARV